MSEVVVFSCTHLLAFAFGFAVAVIMAAASDDRYPPSGGDDAS